MGCSVSKKVAIAPYYTDKDEADFLEIGISHKELEQFSKTFARFDKVASRELDLVEFLIDTQLEFNIITLKIFNFIDGHNDHSISFREVMWSMFAVVYVKYVLRSMSLLL